MVQIRQCCPDLVASSGRVPFRALQQLCRTSATADELSAACTRLYADGALANDKVTLPLPLPLTLTLVLTLTLTLTHNPNPNQDVRDALQLCVRENRVELLASLLKLQARVRANP